MHHHHEQLAVAIVRIDRAIAELDDVDLVPAFVRRDLALTRESLETEWHAEPPACPVCNGAGAHDPDERDVLGRTTPYVCTACDGARRMTLDQAREFGAWQVAELDGEFIAEQTIDAPTDWDQDFDDPIPL